MKRPKADSPHSVRIRVSSKEVAIKCAQRLRDDHMEEAVLLYEVISGEKNSGIGGSASVSSLTSQSFSSYYCTQELSV